MMATDKATGFETLAAFIDANKRSGHHFFDADSARFFRSRWDDGRMYGGRFFITSEQFEGSDRRREPRRYTVRTANLDGSTGAEIGPKLDNITAFQAWATLADARKAATAAADGYAEGLEPEPGGDGNRYGASNALRECYVQGRALRRFDDANAPDKYGNTRADYLREDVKRHQTAIDDLYAQIAALESR